MSASNDRPAVWARLDVPAGLGLGTLIADLDGFRLEGSETVADQRDRFSSRFTVRADLAWVTSEVRVEVLSERGAQVLELIRRGEHWRLDGRPAPSLSGCVDVDVAATPLTNTLPIRRLGLQPGEFRDIPVVWIDVPSLQVRRVVQRYTRLGSAEGRERYEYSDSEHGAFALTVDNDGLVVDYQGLATRVS
ncbi:putative glycolipid-binding domain-containing protein [Allosalinactinospora lopnorensis]|uniref:putative glycolipid-binding domain-containing protein n=1 Tax=Allosalinactinospora lopnorensis TaxID=1352348 RepID=UPI000623CE54|nr:putative glycolipid-binding domain-containing protein [Allosalinactinospora lopnorensis]